MHFDTRDVIAALASPAGPAARSIIRICGDGCREMAATVFRPDDAATWNDARAATRHTGRLLLVELDVELSAAAYVWPTRRSYTGEPLIELHLPGSPPLVEATLAALYRNGIRPARPGEFTLRAFLAGRLDLIQAEAVLGVIDAFDHRELDLALRQLAGGVSGHLADVRSDLVSLLADLEAGLDFVDEDIEFVSRDEVRRRTQDAVAAIESLLADVADRSRDASRLRVVLAGLPNAGKSTLFNALCGKDRAIVSPVAGTTRDWLTAEIALDGVAIELVDTAGWETAADELSTAMQNLREEQLTRADLIIWCTAADASESEVEHGANLITQLGPWRDKTYFVTTKGDLGTPVEIPGRSVESRKGEVPAEPQLRLGAEATLTAQRELRPPVDRPRSETPSKQFALAVSATRGDGLESLRSRIACELNRERSGGRQMLGSTVARGRQSLEVARDALQRVLSAGDVGFGDEVLAAELRCALDGLSAVLGVVYTDDVLDVIFSRFCIGK